MDPAAHRHQRAAHRRSGRRDVGSGEGGGGRRDAPGRASRRNDIGFIVVGTTTPDTIFPSTACLLQHKIGAHHAWGFDLGAACSGFTYALTTGDADGGDRRARARAGRRRRRDVEHHRLHRSDDVRAVRRRRGRGGAVAGRGRGAAHHRLRARDRRQRRPGAVHAGRRQPDAGVARDRRPAAALREAGRPGGVQVRRPQERGDLPPACSSATASSRRSSTCSSRTRPTAGSSPPRPSASGCRRRR